MNEITEVTRRAIVDYLTVNRIQWSGRLPDSDFLARLYDLTQLPSSDGRFQNARSDIRQHRENWTDWPDEWIFTDYRFNLLWAPDDEFLRFLCETVHPVVRPEPMDARSLVESYNSELRKNGWELFEKGGISDRPIFGARKVGGRTKIFKEPTGWEKVDRQIQEIQLRLDTARSEEQFQAVGLLCREALISLAEAVHDPKKHPPIDVISPSKTDAARKLAAFIQVELKGEARDQARAHAKASLDLANALQHKRTADFTDAALCAEATNSVVNIVAITCGRRK